MPSYIRVCQLAHLLVAAPSYIISQGLLIGPFIGRSCPPSSRVRWLGRLLLSLALLHQGFVDWPICWSVTPSYILGFVDWPVCWSVTPSYILGFVDWPVCWSVMPSYIQGSSVDPFVGCCALIHPRVHWLGHSLFSHALLHQGSSVDLFIGHCTLIHPRVRWLAHSLVSHALLHLLWISTSLSNYIYFRLELFLVMTHFEGDSWRSR